MATPLPTPTGLQVRVDVRTFHLRWDPLPDFMGYPVAYYVVVMFIDKVGENQTEYFTKETRMTLTNLDPARTYGVCVGAWYDVPIDRYATYTRYVVCRPLKDPAPTPANLKVRRSFDEIHVQWDKVADTHERRKFETYHLIRYEKNVATPVHIPTKETKYVDKDVKGGKEYAYCIASHYAAEEGSEGVNFAMSAYSPHNTILFKDYKLSIAITTE